MNQNDNGVMPLGRVISAEADETGLVIGVDLAMAGKDFSRLITQYTAITYASRRGCAALYIGGHPRHEPPALSPPDVYQTPLDKRCKRCMQNHPGKPCRSEIQRTRGAKKVRPVYR